MLKNIMFINISHWLCDDNDLSEMMRVNKRVFFSAAKYPAISDIKNQLAHIKWRIRKRKRYFSRHSRKTIARKRTKFTKKSKKVDTDKTDRWQEHQSKQVTEASNPINCPSFRLKTNFANSSAFFLNCVIIHVSHLKLNTKWKYSGFFIS